MNHSHLPRWLAAALLAACLATTAAGQQPAPQAGLRRPVAIVTTRDGKSALVANQASGSISVINLQSREIVAETTIGKHLTSFVPLDATDLYLATDDEAHQLLLVSAPAGQPIEVLQRLAVCP
jgi:DNA-binding beta-propeller fold protein YncE